MASSIFADDEAPEAPAAPVVRLNDLKLLSIVNDQGYINPEIEGDCKAFVFAIYDEQQRLQYVGFSKDIRNSIRTLFTRRPEKAWYYRFYGLPTLDQQAMIQLRDSWFEQVGGAPKGNKLAMERTAWQQPVDAGAISQRGKQGAAEQTAKALIEVFKARGCIEEFIPIPELLADGQVDFQQAKVLSEADLAEQKATQAAAEKRTKQGLAIVDGARKMFGMLIKRKFQTNGGYMFDLDVTLDKRTTAHRVIIGADYYEDYENVTPEQVLEAVFSLLLSAKEARHTEGVLTSGQFPVNYFSVSSLEQWYPEQFQEAFLRATGVSRSYSDLQVWRFNKVKEYGHARGELPLETPTGDFLFAEP